MLQFVLHTPKAVASIKKFPFPFAIYISNDLSRPGIWLWGSALARWNIEVFLDISSRILDGGDTLPCRGEKLSQLSLCIPLIIVVCLRVDAPSVCGIDERFANIAAEKRCHVKIRMAA